MEIKVYLVKKEYIHNNTIVIKWYDFVNNVWISGVNEDCLVADIREVYKLSSMDDSITIHSKIIYLEELKESL